MSAATQTVDLECCGPEEPRNPKAEIYRRRRRPAGLQLYQVKNPIPDEVRDSDEIQTLFKRWNFVPYAGTTKESGQMLLVWYLMLANLSATHNACISKKLKYAVGGKATFVRSVDPEWDTGEEVKPLSTPDKVRYRDAINEFIEFEGGVGKFHRRIGWGYESTGNAWIEMTYSETMGVARIHLKAHRVTHCLYVNTKPGEMRVVAISPVWTDEYLNKHEPRYLNVYPRFTSQPDGSLKTIFHLKNGENDWYGRPESRGADLYKYREVQDAMYLVKQAGANFTGQLIIEVEDDDPEYSEAIENEGAQKVGFNSFSERFEHNYTQKSDDPQSVLVTARPYGSRPMFVFQVSPNTNQDWYKVTGEIAEKKIRQAHGCTPRFMGEDVSNGFAIDVVVGDYVMYMEPVINELRDVLTRFTNDAVTVAWVQLLDQMQWDQFSISFMPPIQSAVEEFKKKQVAPAIQPVQTNNPATPPDPNTEDNPTDPNNPPPKKAAVA